ncbi:MAG: hypothetical protein ACK5V3_16225 [Bdellovibrionales bacterium]
MLFIIPSQLSAGTGLNFLNQGLQVEVFLAADLISMFPGGERPDNFSLGLRGRLDIDKSGRHFIEIGGQKYLLKQEQSGAQLSRFDFGVGKRQIDGDLLVISYSVTKTNPGINYPDDTSIKGLMFRIQSNYF